MTLRPDSGPARLLLELWQACPGADTGGGEMSKPDSCQPNAMPTGYTQWHDEAERRYRAGAEQARCLTCELYRFADEACPLATFQSGREPRRERKVQP